MSHMFVAATFEVSCAVAQFLYEKNQHNTFDESSLKFTKSEAAIDSIIASFST